MNEPNVTYPVNEVLGFTTSVKGMLNTYKAQMIAAKMDPTDLIAKLTADHEALTDANTAQEALKTQLRDATATVEGKNTTAYNDASKGCDMVIIALGKRSEQAAEAVALRKGVRPVARKPKNNTPPDAPAK